MTRVALMRGCPPLALALLLLATPVGAVGESDAGRRVEFARDVYPILKRACFDCHGTETQKADLRLDAREVALEAEGVIVGGNPEESELIFRVTLPPGDPAIMPSRGQPLSEDEIEILQTWIAQGADWPEDLDLGTHWAYAKPIRPALPAVSDREWPRNAIDRFILARLEREGLRPAPEADRATLIRRASLDLIGLPPTPTEIDAFLADDRPDAYERLVDRLLASPEFGARWARPWLDLARYADSHGYQRDDLRDTWAYRDWVVDALNADMPFDRFTIEQIAGDLLPDATPAQRIATGFHRASPTNVEAGSIPEETRINQVIDRVDTTATVWLGATLACAQCHDHKYDPFTQREYYQLLAFFNSTEIEADRSNPKVPGSIRFLGAAMPLVDPDRDGPRRQLEADLAATRDDLAERRRILGDDLEAWAGSAAAELESAARIHPLSIDEFVSEEGASKILDDGSILLTDDPPARDTYEITAHTDLAGIRAFKLEALTDPSLPGTGPGRGDAERPNFVLNTFSVTAGPLDGGADPRPVELAGARASFSQARFDVAGAIDDDPKTAWAIGPQFGSAHWAIFRTDRPIGAEGGTTLTFRLVQDFGGGRTIGRLRLSAITGDPDFEGVAEDVARLLRIPSDDWKTADRETLLDAQAAEDARSEALRRKVDRLKKQIAGLVPETTQVMRELDESRPTHLFRRGDYRSPGEEVEPATPAVLHPMPDGPRDRLALARWLVDPENPLVARVAVNRWWAELFGQGLIGTPDDFGIKGDPPTHPDLLDWLAVELMDEGWSLKRILGTIATSAAYRQDSSVTPEALARDPSNALHARGPRFRMDAEMVRDNALAIGGLLSPEQGGPPIRPFQPEGLWTKIGGAKVDYVVSPGSERHRRGIYVVFKRGSPYPSLLNFDASTRLECVASRTRTNTPQQALTLLNDPVFVEVSTALARRILEELPDAGLDRRLAHAFRLCTGRRPDADEKQILRRLYDGQLQAARDQPTHREDRPIVAGASPAEFDAWRSVATTLLNLDETITKN